MVEQEEGQRRHTNNDIWSRVHEQGKSIADLQTGLGKLEARVEGGFAGLSSEVRSVLGAIDRLSQPKPPQDIKGWLGFALTALGILGVIGLLVVTPIQEGQRRIEDRQWNTHGQHSYDRGYSEAYREKQ